MKLRIEEGNFTDDTIPVNLLDIHIGQINMQEAVKRVQRYWPRKLQAEPLVENSEIKDCKLEPKICVENVDGCLVRIKK